MAPWIAETVRLLLLMSLILVNPIVLPGTKAEVILCQRLRVYSDSKDQDEQYLRGLGSSLDDIDHPSITVGNDWQGEFTTLVVPDFFPGGSICLLRTWVDNYDDTIDTFVRSGADERPRLAQQGHGPVSA